MDSYLVCMRMEWTVEDLLIERRKPVKLKSDARSCVPVPVYSTVLVSARPEMSWLYSTENNLYRVSEIKWDGWRWSRRSQFSERITKTYKIRDEKRRDERRRVGCCCITSARDSYRALDRRSTRGLERERTASHLAAAAAPPAAPPSSPPPPFFSCFSRKIAASLRF